MYKKIKLMSIAGARPNFMKLASIAKAVENHNKQKCNTTHIDHIIVHTGQHYDSKMSETFFHDLEIPEPDINLEVGSGGHAIQTAEIMKRFEPVLYREQPDALLVVGDINSTIACALVAAKIQYNQNHFLKRPLIVHVEAGLRSFDRNMPEEINRILTDAISDLLFVTEQSGIDNLKNEGVPNEKIHFVGNVMIDTLQCHLEKAGKANIKEKLAISGKYGLVTLHRPSNVDSISTLEPLVMCLVQIAKKIPLFFPVHPRTKKSILDFNLADHFNWDNFAEATSLTDNTIQTKVATNPIMLPPLGYLDFLNLTQSASVVITDSGGIQEETTFLKIPCLTLRENTERPITITEGSNYLIGTDTVKISTTVNNILTGKMKNSTIPELWDGKAGKRIIALLIKHLEFMGQN